MHANRNVLVRSSLGFHPFQKSLCGGRRDHAPQLVIGKKIIDSVAQRRWQATAPNWPTRDYQCMQTLSSTCHLLRLCVHSSHCAQVVDAITRPQLANGKKITVDSATS
jgi:hypothetical protein